MATCFWGERKRPSTWTIPIGASSTSNPGFISWWIADRKEPAVNVLVICSENSEAVESFVQCVRAGGLVAQRLTPGQALPSAEQGVLGAVYFDQGEPDLSEVLQRQRAQLRFC